MNILLVTLFKENYGAFLQTYAMTVFLRKMGHEVFLKNYDFIPKTNFQNELNNMCNNLFSYYNQETIDLIMCGSDEIWNIGNPECTNRMDFWGKGFDRKIKIVSYAPSAAGTGFRQTIFRAWRLNRFAALSARDKRTIKIIQPFVKKRIQEVVDPTFLIDWSEYLIEPKSRDYIFVYSYGLSSENQRKILEYAQKYKKRIICCGGVNIDGADIFEGSPFEWVGLFKCADMVFTSTFHGTVFSIMFHKKFMPMGNSLKIKLLLEDILFEDYERNIVNESDVNWFNLSDKITCSKRYIQENL